jgi:hypothetical protein
MKLRAEIIEKVLLFIRARHIGDVQEAGKHQMWLKSKLKKSYSSVLLKHGDPDRDYMATMQKWFKEERQAVRK